MKINACFEERQKLTAPRQNHGAVRQAARKKTFTLSNYDPLICFIELAVYVDIIQRDLQF